jgi:hypothetical protein
MSTYTYGQPLKRTTVATYPEKRACSAPGCTTRLSIYNASRFCWLHDPIRPKRGVSPTRF